MGREWSIQLTAGKLCGKWYGRDNIRPILFFHDRHANACSFNGLIGFLPTNRSYLAIDLPGHGRSDHVPFGCLYTTYHMMLTLVDLMNKTRWKTLSIVTHGISSEWCYNLLPALSDKIDLYITIDSLKLPVCNAIDLMYEWKSNIIEHYGSDLRMQNEYAAPTYERKFIEREIIEGSCTNLTPEDVVNIVNRNYACVPKTRRLLQLSDRRNVLQFDDVLSQEVAIEIAAQIEFPFCFIRATKPQDEVKLNDVQKWSEVSAVMKQTNQYFEEHFVYGDHYLHILNPGDALADIITNFINTHRPVKLKWAQKGKNA